MKRLALCLLIASVAHAQTAGKVCEVARPMQGQRLLRRLSLDLRDTVPSEAEQAAQQNLAEVPDAKLDEMIGSPQFISVMRGYHRELLWPNIDTVNLDTLQMKLSPYEIAPGVTVYFSALRALMLRSVTQQFPPCRNAPLQLNADGSPRTTPLIVNGQTVANQEGWVEVEPYWAPGTRVKVCGFDALATPTAPACSAAATAKSAYLAQFCESYAGYLAQVGGNLIDAPIACDGQFAILAPGCGCGPKLQWCNTDETAAQIRRSLLEQELRLVDAVIENDRPYTEILTAKTVQMNGPIAHYLTYQSRSSADVFGETDLTAPVPAGLSFAEADRWVDVVRTGRHSGVLTTPGYLLKFQSNRARAHRFYNAFECSSFLPDGPLPPPSEPCSKHEDLTKRCGCQACHVQLEPMAASWGRFAEYGFTPLSEARYPKSFTEACSTISDLDTLFRCFRFYQVDAVGEETPFKLELKPYVFRTDEQVARLEAGPGELAAESISSGRFATCTVRKLWAYFMRRLPTAEEEATVVQELVKAFTDDHYRLRGLVKAIVSQPAYRRVP